MDVIRHHNPSMEIIAITVEEHERPFHEGTNSVVTQMTRAVAGVEVLVEPLAKFEFALGGRILFEFF